MNGLLRVCRKLGVSKAAFYMLKKQYAGLVCKS
jgi:hypothetical protein